MISILRWLLGIVLLAHTTAFCLGVRLIVERWFW